MTHHPAAASDEQLWAECEVRRLRRSGPGGQHRNKVETAISLRHLPTGVTAEASERRSQAQNRAMALFRLRVNLAIELRTAIDDVYRPSVLWQSRCRGVLKVSPTSDDLPALLAESLDVLAACDFNPKLAAERLGCTPSQLIRLLKVEPRGLQWVNQQRALRQLHTLK